MDVSSSSIDTANSFQNNLNVGFSDDPYGGYDDKFTEGKNESMEKISDKAEQKRSDNVKKGIASSALLVGGSVLAFILGGPVGLAIGIPFMLGGGGGAFTSFKRAWFGKESDIIDKQAETYLNEMTDYGKTITNRNKATIEGIYAVEAQSMKNAKDKQVYAGDINKTAAEVSKEANVGKKEVLMAKNIATVSNYGKAIDERNYNKVLGLTNSRSEINNIPLK